jgi:hypothetical protein
MPAVGEVTARRGSASVRKATRALTAQQVGRGTFWVLAPVGWGGRMEKRGQNNSQFGHTHSLAVATVCKFITVDGVIFRIRSGSLPLRLEPRQ